VEYGTKSKLEGREGSIIYTMDDSKFFAYFTGYRIVSLSIVSRWYRSRKGNAKMTCLVPCAREHEEVVAAPASSNSYTLMITHAAVCSRAHADNNATEA
jgi:hypothetical protein